MRLCDLSQALSTIAVPQDGRTIEFERLASDVTGFELGSPHAGTNPLDDQAALQFSDRSDDNDDGPPQRSASVGLLAEADELVV